MPASHNARSDRFRNGISGGSCETCGAPCARKYCRIDCYRVAQRSGSDTERFWAKVQKTDGCWLWTASRAGGRSAYKYGQFTITRDGVQQHIYAHIYSYQIHHGPVPEGLEVLHACNRGICVRPDHLSAGTRLQNVQDAARDGLYSVAHPKSHKLTTADLVIVDDLLAQGWKQNRIAERFDVSEAWVSNYARGLTRQHDRPAAALRRIAS